MCGQGKNPFELKIFKKKIRYVCCLSRYFRFKLAILSQVRTSIWVRPVLNRVKMSNSRIEHSASCEAQTTDHSISSRAFYHRATALILADLVLYLLVPSADNISKQFGPMARFGPKLFDTTVL